jgi:hypothetical protein
MSHFLNYLIVIMTSKHLLLFLVFSSAGGDPCTFCDDGSAVTLPDYMVQLPGFPALSCSSIDTMIPSLFPDATSSDCALAHQVSSVCGCPVIAESCNVCGDRTQVPKAQVLVEEFAEIFQGNVPTCEFVVAYLRSFHQNDDMCLTSQEKIGLKCGCYNDTQIVNETDVKNDGDSYGQTNDSNGPEMNADSSELSGMKDYIAHANYFGAVNDEERIRLFIVSRTAAILSAICCIIVIYDCLRFKQKRRNLYHQIVGTMSIFDLMYSFLLSLGTLPMDRNDNTFFPGKCGNIITCKLQGSLMQLSGGVSLLLNCSLSTCKFRP